LSSAFLNYEIEREKICEIFPGRTRLQLQLQVTIHKMGEILFCSKRMYHQLEDIDHRDRRERKNPKIMIKWRYYKVEDGGEGGMGVQLCKCDSVANSSVFIFVLIG
jgi:hypothetical protein